MKANGKNILVSIGLLVLLAACSQSAPQATPPTGQPFGLAEVSIDLSNQASPTASLEWVQPLDSQAITVRPINGTSALNDVQITRSLVSFYDDTINNKRYVIVTFNLTNRMTVGFSNLTLYAVNVPEVTQAGTGVVSMRTAANTLITNGVKYRTLRPTHGVGSNLAVNSSIADLQWVTGPEASSVQSQALSQGLIGNTATVLEYGFVARSLSNTRNIAARNTATDCTSARCKGTVTLAYSFPISSPTSDPTRFSLYFVVGDESSPYVSQSVEEQGANTAAGIGGLPGVFSQVRTLRGNTYTGTRENDLCSVRTALPTPTFPGNVYMPTTLATAPGSLDSCFDADGKVTTVFSSLEDKINSIAIGSDGKIVAAGYREFRTSMTSQNITFALARYNSNGSLDTSFDTDGRVVTRFFSDEEIAHSVAIQSDGKIVAAGYADHDPTSSGSNADFALARYNTSGSLDTSFGTGGKVITDFGSSDAARAMAIQPDGKIVVAGNSGSNFALARYNPSGSLDITFGIGGKVTTAIGDPLAFSLAIQPDGKIVLAGGINDFALARYNTSGSLDTSFGTGGKVITDFGSSDGAYSIAIQSDGKIVVAGYSGDGNAVFALARYNQSGTLDTSFGVGGKVTTAIGTDDYATSLAIQPNGKIVAGGVSLGSTYDFALARYNPDGTLDTSFDTDGKVTTAIGTPGLGTNFDVGRSLALQSDGKIVLAGSSGESDFSDFALARYNP